MSKQLSHREVLEAIQTAIETEACLDTEDKVYGLVSDLAELVCKHLGYEAVGVLGPIDEPPEGAFRRTQLTFDQCWSVGFLPNECTPSDGGVLAAYDTDVTIKEWWVQGGLDPSDAVEPQAARAGSGESGWLDQFNAIAERQGWGADTERLLLLRFIDEHQAGSDLRAFAQQVADEENAASAALIERG